MNETGGAETENDASAGIKDRDGREDMMRRAVISAQSLCGDASIVYDEIKKE